MELYVIAAAADRDSVVKQRGGRLEHIQKMYSHIQKSIHFFQYLEDAKKGASRIRNRPSSNDKGRQIQLIANTLVEATCSNDREQTRN